MREVKGRLIERIKRTPTIESFRFQTEERIEFIPGQFLEVIFDEYNRANKELNKYLSFSSSPTTEYIQVTKRLSESRFSLRLRSAQKGDVVLFKAPLGQCVFQENYEKIGFLIGGIGITPVVSIIEYIVEKNLNTNAVLFYSNKTEEETAFKQELDQWQKTNPAIKIVYTVTDIAPQSPSYLKGRITKDMVIGEDKDFAQRIVFIFGPPKMVDAMHTLSAEIGCKRENIKTESFIGY